MENTLLNPGDKIEFKIPSGNTMSGSIESVIDGQKEAAGKKLYVVVTSMRKYAVLTTNNTIKKI